MNAISNVIIEGWEMLDIQKENPFGKWDNEYKHVTKSARDWVKEACNSSKIS